MAFKLNKPSMVQGTKRYKSAIEAIKLNREASSSKTKEGRAESSAFQKADSSMKSYAEAKKRDPKLDEYIKARNAAEKGSPEYNAAQNKINKAYGKGPTDRPTTTTASETTGSKTTTKTRDAAKPGEVKTNVKDDARGTEKRTIEKDDGSKRTIKIKGKNRRTTPADESASARAKGTKTKIKDTDAEGKVVRKEKVRKDKEGKVKSIKVKAKDPVTGKVTKTKIDSEGNETVKERKGFKGTEVGKFLAGKKKDIKEKGKKVGEKLKRKKNWKELNLTIGKRGKGNLKSERYSTDKDMGFTITNEKKGKTLKIDVTNKRSDNPQVKGTITKNGKERRISNRRARRLASTQISNEITDKINVKK